MAISLQNSWNVPPARWGSFADVQHAIKVNSEKIYDIEFDDFVTVLPFFWGHPVVDHSSKHLNFINTNQFYYKNNSVSLPGDKFAHTFQNQLSDDDTKYSVYSRLRLSRSGTDEIIAARRNHTNYNPILYQLYISSNVINFITRNNIRENTALASGTTSLTVGETISFLGVRDTNNVYVYCKGNLEGSDSDSGGTITTTRSSIGAFYDGSWRGYLMCDMYDLCIIRNALTAKQASLLNSLPYALYQKTQTPFHLSPITAAIGWTGKLNHITNPAKINGIAVANIASVMEQ